MLHYQVVKLLAPEHKAHSSATVKHILICDVNIRRSSSVLRPFCLKNNISLNVEELENDAENKTSEYARAEISIPSAVVKPGM